jgi:TonB-linked SusC/RagA family outer membrane protein
MEQKRFLLSFLTLLLSTIMYAQQEITGTVTDAFGPVIGATVMEKGTTNGTVTDFDGNFKLKVEAGKMLVFSYVGYLTQELPAANGMEVAMKEDSKQLQEVVVTGYTTQRKADLTGAVSTVSVDELAKQNENNPIKALQGRVPGMNIAADGSPSGSATVRIRGIGTLNNNDPLYIIDGVPTKAGMHELNGNDIESIQVLKDAASASIYGSRAANGVIIITTKGGKDGKIKIDLDASVAMQTYVHKMEVLNAKEFGQVMWQGYVNDGLDPNANGLGYRYDWTYNQQGTPVLNGISMSKYLDAAGTTPAADTDWFNQTTRTGLIQQYNVSLSNGSEKGSSFFSLGYYKNKGIIKQSDFERLSARINTEYKLVKIGDRNLVTVGEHFTLNRTNEVQAPGGFLENVLQFNPSLPVYTRNGDFAGPVGGYPDRENPVARLQRNSDNRYTFCALSEMHISISILSRISISSQPSVWTMHKRNSAFSPTL